MNTKAKRRIIIFSILTAFMLAFIWGNSVLDRGSSGHLSTYITEIIKKLFDSKDKLDFDTVHAFVRKTAHFLEFFTLGLMFSLLKNNIEDAAGKSLAVLPPFAALFSAVTDEYIQYFTGRGSAVSDIVLDFAGSLVAILLVCAFSSKKDKKI